MSYTKIEILGYRGFGQLQTLYLAVPDGRHGSGLTVIVGPNNSGKSTIIEAFKAISQNSPPSFTEGRRNRKTSEKVKVTIFRDDDVFLQLDSAYQGGSETTFTESGLPVRDVKIMVLPSRRTFNPFFGKSVYSRDQYIHSSPLPAVRGGSLQSFEYRIFNIQKSEAQLAQFNAVLNKVLDPVPQWTIDQNDSGQYYIKFNFNGLYHNSDGAGEGLLSLFTIVDALYDSSEGDTIVIDEPELSLHPSLQRKLADLIEEYSMHRQIVVSTHSPYFISWPSVFNGGKIARTNKDSSGDIVINQLQESTKKELSGLLKNLNNPHILGLDSKEVFFLTDNIVLLEGQEDVVFFKQILKLLNKKLDGTFYGWGVGGAPNMTKILQVLQDIGFHKCAIILDNNMQQLKESISRQFPEYKVHVIPTDDIRDKDEIKARASISGLINRSGTEIKYEHQDSIGVIIDEINKFMKG